LKDEKAIAKELNALHKIRFKAEFKDKIPLPFDKIAGAVKFPGQAQFHPLKFIAGLSKNLNIFEHTFVKELAPNTAITNRGKITADNIIVATHFPFLNKHGAYFLKMFQHRSYAVALENAENINGMYLEEKENGMSFRNYNNLLIIGGGDHRTGRNMNKKNSGRQVLRDFAGKTYPEAQEKYAWATQDCITLDGVPYIGKYGGSSKNLYVATGFNKWGMTSSMISAMMLTDMILGQTPDYAEVFSPQRSMMKLRLLGNAFTAVGNLLTPSAKRCPHMGCALKYNKAEQSWDCPCHGSRFVEDGKLLDGPATGGLRRQG
jgi:glycine/D-amino acid oxidase-like deaminating enzyme